MKEKESKVEFINFTDETVRKIYQTLIDIWCEKNNYNYKVTVKVKKRKNRR